MDEIISCKRCAAEMIEIHCKRICLTCGASEDCTDLSIEPDHDDNDESEN